MPHHFYENTPYAFNPLAIQTLVVSLGVIVLGIVALIREQGSHVSVVYFVLTFSIGVWLFAFSWMYSAIDVQLAMWWAKVGYVGIAFIPPAVFHFSSLIAQDYERVRRRVLASWMISSVFITLIITTDIQFSSLYHYGFGFYPESRKTGLPFLLYFFGVMIFSLRSFLAWFRAKPKGSAQYTRAKIFFLAFIVGYIAALDFAVTFGAPLYPIGYLAIACFTVISMRFVIRYRFMDITPAFAARQIFDTMNDALIVLDPDGAVRLVNRATCSLFGLREQDLVGKPPAADAVGDRTFSQRLDAIVRNGLVQNLEVDYQRPGGAHHILNLAASIMRNPAGEPLATVCVLNDITDRKQAEEEREDFIARLQEANEKLKTVDKMKTEFVSVVSHELRTPLTTIKAFVELILMKPDMPDQKRAAFMNTINVEADRLKRMITDLLDLARIESGSIAWQRRILSIEDIVKDAVVSMGPLFENKELRVTTSFGSQLPAIAGDRDRLVQVVLNILSNAAKFTPQGGAIHITARQEPAAEGVVVAISDTGIGILPESLELIFEKFHRSGEPAAGGIEGTGLGLAIARQIVEHHGGRIWAASERGKGSTFTFILPPVGSDTPVTPEI